MIIAKTILDIALEVSKRRRQIFMDEGFPKYLPKVFFQAKYAMLFMASQMFQHQLPYLRLPNLSHTTFRNCSLALRMVTQSNAGLA